MIKNIPLYPHSYETAKKNGRQEMDPYKASHSANMQCAEEIKEAIDSHYDGAYLAQGCENEMIEKYGFERVNFVTAPETDISFTHIMDFWIFSQTESERRNSFFLICHKRLQKAKI